MGPAVPCAAVRPALVFVWTAVASAALALEARSAHALRPDFDGERGIELDVAAGFGTFTNTSQHLFTRATMVSSGVMPRNALSGGLHLAAHLGYRFLPFLSAGVTGQYQFLGAEPFMRSSGPAPAAAEAASVGVYVRLYYLGLITGSYRVRRVRMDQALDARRLDPWLSVGLDVYQTLALAESPGSQFFARWHRTSVGVPVALGFDVRPIAPLAIGVAATLNTWIGSNTRLERSLDTGTGNPRMESESYESADPVNLQLAIDLNVRYTLTL